MSLQEYNKTINHAQFKASFLAFDWKTIWSVSFPRDIY